MVDFNALLERKYAILGQQADADMMRAQASANYDSARAAALGPESARQNALNKAQIGQMGAQSKYYGALGIQAGAAADESREATEALRLARPPAPGGGAPGGPPSLGGMLSTTPIEAQRAPMPSVQFGQQFGQSFSGSAPATSASSNAPNNGDWSRQNAASEMAGVKSVQPMYKDKSREGGGISMSGFKKGTARVPGKGSPKKDSVPAVLAPGEAVLNAKAAEMAGRDNIAALNRKGAAKMGMVPGKGNMPGHYACGTAKVGRYATGTANVPGADASNNVQRMLRADDAPMSAPRPGPIPQVGGPDPRMTMWNPTNLPPAGPPVQMLSPRPDAPYPGGAPQGRSMAQIEAAIGGGAPAFAAPAPLVANRPPPIPSVPTPAGPHWSMPAAGGAPLPPTRPVLLGGPSPVPPPVPQGRSVDDFMAQRGLSFAPQRSFDQDFIDAHQPSAPPAPMAPSMDFIPQPPIMQPDLGVQRARTPGGFDQAFAAARKRAGGAGGMFEYGGKSYQTNLEGEKFRAKPRRV